MKLPDIKPTTKVASLNRDHFLKQKGIFSTRQVSLALGMAPGFIRKVCGSGQIKAQDVLLLLDQDCYSETLVPRSRVLEYLSMINSTDNCGSPIDIPSGYSLLQGHVLERIASLPKKSIQCVVTSTPYWGLRIYQDPFYVRWADAEYCPFGHEQTPEGFLRHTTEVLAALYDVLDDEGSIWWNVMDSFNTRTQIRGNAAEALRAMQGKDKRTWSEHECRRYSAGHSYLKDGEQCLIPSRIAERASRIGYFVKSVITWAKTSTLPEPQESRVSRSLEYIIHITKTRAPRFNKGSYLNLPSELGGRNDGGETEKLSDVWSLSTSSGLGGHGAQFPVSLPGRCIALSTNQGDVVLDPFVGAGNSGVAAMALGRRFIGIDVSAKYLATAEQRISGSAVPRPLMNSKKSDRLYSQGTLL